MEGILGIIAAVLGIVAMVLKARLSREKSKGEKIAEAADRIGSRAAVIRRKIAEGKADEVGMDMDDLVRRVDLLLRAKDRDSGKEDT